ncbi:NAD(P)-dependent oxidoreductase [Methylobacterium sp. E-045]|uniref:NAD(P)-dependent oxidoreductase n=1 Tax=Methylobacterium sp. E-045 TaxID=2836575 RepID=UPI001FB932E5|nr:SDR family oxidoreductase [Methylobacterium sp. E-045]MCJ2130684.1 SDR family oxidoreductase [Methylobacterium sp. E-045]
MIDTANTVRRNILVLGATGGTGRHIVAQALAQGHAVTALVRSPDKAKDLAGARLVTGDARDEAALRAAVIGQEAVVIALGTPASPFREVTLLSTATRALIAAMKAERVSRLVAISGIGAGDSRGHGGFLFDRLIFPLLLRHVYADKDRQEALVRNSGLDWTLVRPAILNDKPGRGTLRATDDLSGFNGGVISREDVARFVIGEVADPKWIGRSPLVFW